MTTGYQRGAFIAYEPSGYPDQKRVIPFRFNPEGLSRQLSLEKGESGQGTEGGQQQQSAGSGAAGAGGQASDASSGTLKHSFAVTVRFDFDDRHEASQNLPEELGVAPEIAALEDLLYPASQPSDQNADGSEAVQQRAQRPTVLFVWGKKRVLPVKITQMTIAETSYNAELNPVRAEVEVELEVLGETEARDNEAVRSSLEFTDGKRRELAQMFLERTSDQSSNILPL